MFWVRSRGLPWRLQLDIDNMQMNGCGLWSIKLYLVLINKTGFGPEPQLVDPCSGLF